jgi:glycerol-3-phosphate O-acyltransferase
MLRREGIARGPVDDEEIISELIERVVLRFKNEDLSVLLNDTCFREEKRLSRSKDQDEQAYLARLRDARRQLSWATPVELERLLRGIIEGYGHEIHGHFDPRLYESATRVAPKGLALLLRKQAPWQLLKRAMTGGINLSDRVIARGEVETFDRLVEMGTCILVPTHSSNLDSPVMGFALHSAGLPPMIYGAGINLFTNWLLSYFMDNLGAYRVDRAKKHRLYKETLKEYSTLALERRWHSLFFPGGTRSRSGRVESDLKKGLMGTGLNAYQANLREDRQKARVFFVPATINYHLVLEAETLIEDSLQEEGQSRYIITDDEFSRPDRVLQFARNLMKMSNPIEVVFGRPLDPFGNFVDASGNSLDPQGNPFDPRGYVSSGGRVVEDRQRDREYTSRLSGRIADAFTRDTVYFGTHLLASAMHRRVEVHNPGLDRYQRLLLGLDARRFTSAEVEAEMAHMLEVLRPMEERGELRLGEELRTGTPESIRTQALRQFGRYHKTRAVWGRSGACVLEDPRLALYYANRLDGVALPPPLPADGWRT